LASDPTTIKSRIAEAEALEFQERLQPQAYSSLRKWYWQEALERKQALSPEAQALLATKNRLERLAQRVRHDPKASDAINTKVASVQTAILEALPKTVHASEQYDVHTLRQIADDYFPKTLEYFLETDTPAALFRSQVISDNKSAEAVFLEQLDILENAIGDILITVHNDSTQSLIANARFLRERFRKSDFESISKN
jgi:hypothetical protein